METLVANLTGKTRRTMRNGREYVVAPMTLIVPGVLNGSRGPLLYPPEEIARSVDAWNGMPLTVNHPIGSSGNHISARDPAVLDEQGIGEVFNSQVGDKGILTADAWFDVNNAQRVDTRIVSLLEKGETIGLSTGLSLDSEPVANGSEHEGVPYSFTTSNYRPDHLAILLDQKGACSVDDGCGVLVNKEQIEEIVMTKLAEADRKKIVDGLIANNCCWKEEDREVLNALSDEKLGLWKEQAEKDKARELVVNAAQKGFEDSGGNAHTFNAEKKEWESKMKKQPTANEDLVDSIDPAQLKPGDSFERVAVPHVENANGYKYRIKRGSTTMDKPPTAEEWMKNAPQEIQNTLRHAQGIETREKGLLIDRLVTNAADKDVAKKMLGTKSLSELQGLLALIPQETQPAQSLPSYLGQSVPAYNAQPELDQDDVLPLPVTNYAAEAKVRDSELQKQA